LKCDILIFIMPVTHSAVLKPCLNFDYCTDLV